MHDTHNCEDLTNIPPYHVCIGSGSLPIFKSYHHRFTMLLQNCFRIDISRKRIIRQDSQDDTTSCPTVLPQFHIDITTYAREYRYGSQCIVSVAKKAYPRQVRGFPLHLHRLAYQYQSEVICMIYMTILLQIIYCNIPTTCEYNQAFTLTNHKTQFTPTVCSNDSWKEWQGRQELFLSEERRAVLNLLYLCFDKGILARKSIQVRQS